MNFIHFHVDEMRAESAGCYGHPLVETPNLDAFAAQGTLFEQCHVQHTVCSPSRCAMFTGLYPHVSGHRTLWHLLSPWEPNLFFDLKAAGYQHFWSGKNDLLAPDSFAHIDVYGEVPGEKGAPGEISFGDPGYYSFLQSAISGGVDTLSDYRNTMAAIDFLKTNKAKEKPFYVYLPLVFPHPTYNAPEPYHSMYHPDDISLRPQALPDKPDYVEAIRRYRELKDLPESWFQKIQAVYLGMITCVDHIFGLLLHEIAQLGLEENTTVLFTSDHGDWAGDYGLVEKWPSALDDTLTRIPVVIRGPGLAKGHRVSEPVESFDLMPTVLELAGTKAKHTHFAQSWVPQLQGGVGDSDRAVFAEGGYDLHEPHCFEGKPEDGLLDHPSSIYYPKAKQQQEEPQTVCRSVMLRTATHKLVRRTRGVQELYNMVEDPQELSNVYEDKTMGQVRANLEARLLAWYMTTSDTTPRDPHPRGYVSPSS